MKLRTIVKIAITSSVVLLCSGFALYSFFRLSAAEDQKDFDLYTLVPSSVSAVFATEDVAEFVMEVDELTCSRDHQYLYVSKLFSYLKQSLYALSEDTETISLFSSRRCSSRSEQANESDADQFS